MQGQANHRLEGGGVSMRQEPNRRAVVLPAALVLLAAGLIAMPAYSQSEPAPAQPDSQGENVLDDLFAEPAAPAAEPSAAAGESSSSSPEAPTSTEPTAESIAGQANAAAPLDVIPVGDASTPKDQVTSKAPPVVLEEIVVTAQKRTERVQDIPVSVTVTNSERMQDAGVQQLEDITKVAPSIQLTGSSGGKGSVITVRGVRTEAASVGVPAKVGIVVDDIPQHADARWFNELADVERMEMLVGPQSTVSPRNASGGLINIVTRQPTMDPSGKLVTSYADDGEVRNSLFLSGPLAEEELAASLSGYYNDWDGNIYHDTLGRVSGREAYGVRGKLLWVPAADWEVTLTGQFGQLQQKDGYVVYQRFGPGASFLAPSIGGISVLTPQLLVGDYDYSYLENNRTNSSAKKPFQTNDYHGGNLRIQTTIWDHDLMSISGIQKDKTDGVFDLTGLNLPIQQVWCQCQYTLFESDTFSQELRLVSPYGGAFTYVFGLVYLDSIVEQDQQRPVLGPSDYYAESGLKNYAAYGRGTLAVTEDLEITAGLRYNVEEISYYFLNRGAYLEPLPIGLPQGDYDAFIALLNALPVQLPLGLGNSALPTSHSDEHSERVVLGDISLQYHFAEDVMGYFRYARGYQGAVFDLGQTGEGPYTPTPAEHSNAFELGLKSQWFDRRLTFNTSVFYTKYTDYQAQTAVVTPSELTVKLLNVGELETKGIEASLVAQVLELTAIDLSATYITPKIIHIDNAPCYPNQSEEQGCVDDTQDLDGKRLNGAPDFRIVGGLTQFIPFESLPFDLTLRLDGKYQTDVNYNISGSPYSVEKAYGTANASLKLGSKGGSYEATFFVQNLTNKHYTFGISDAGGFWNAGATATKGLPRDWERVYGLRLTYNFFR